MDVKQAVMAELDKIAASGEKMPALRVLRARVGKGSLTTVSEAVKEWESAQIALPQALPNDLSFDEKTVICGAIWRAIAPMLQTRLDSAQEVAAAKIQLEREQAKQMREETEAALAEAAARAEELKKANALVEELRQRLSRSEDYEQWMKKELESYKNTIGKHLSERDEARRRVAALEAEVATLNRLLPLVNAAPAAETAKK